VTHFLFRAEAKRPAALNAGHAPGLWRQLLQRHDARLKLLRRASGWIESPSAVNSQLLCDGLWGELLPQLVFHSAQTQESTDGQRSWQTHGRLGQSRPATRQRAHHPQKSSGETSDTIATEAATSIKTSTVGAGSPTARRQSVATESRLHTPARAHPKPSRRVRRMLWPATRPGQLTAHLQLPDAESQPVPDVPSLAADLHEGEQASSGERAAKASGGSPDGGDLQRTRLSICELPREASRQLLLRFQQPQPSSSVMMSAIYTHGSTRQDYSDASSDDRPNKHRFQNREAQTVAAQSRPTALSYGQLRDEPRDDESDSPARPRHAARNVSTRKRTRVKTATHQIFETAAPTGALRQMPYQTRHGQRREPPGQEISASELRETWRGELAKRVSRLIGVTGSYAVAPVASAHMALTEQIAATLEGQTAPPDLLLALVGRSILHSQAGRENSQRRRQTSAHARTASKADVQAFNHKRDAFLTPVRRSRQSPGSSGGLNFYDETPHEYQGGPVLEREFGSEEVSLIVKERSASPAAAVSEQHATTFAAATVLPPLVPPQTSEANELAVAVAVARQGAFSESLTEAEDLDALAEKIKLILDEQARRHGIDV
jgi:hypothetical protein